MNLRLLCISLIACTLGIHSQLIAELTILDTEGEIRILHGNKPVLQYVKTSRPVPSGLEGYFQRSGYIHPVYTPTGQEFTGDYPLDHAHQHALFFALVSKISGIRQSSWPGLNLGVFAILVVVVTRFHSQQNTTFSCDWITKKRTSFMRRGL